MIFHCQLNMKLLIYNKDYDNKISQNEMFQKALKLKFQFKLWRVYNKCINYKTANLNLSTASD